MASYGAIRSLLQSPHLHSSDKVPSLTVNEALSGIFGSISLVSWIFVFVPQLIENYKQKSAAGVSMLFIFIWFIGDTANVIGAFWAELVPTVIAIAVYYVFSDIVIGGQCAYYNFLQARKDRRIRSASADTGRTDATEDEPLLSRRESSAARSSRPHDDNDPHSANGTLSKIAEEDALRNQSTTRMEWIKNAASILIICLVGTAAWAISWKIGLWKPTPLPRDSPHSSSKSAPLGAEILGYVSAFLYLAARIPQIVKNWKQQSCEGLSLLFFLLSLLGNLTYGASILFHSLDKQYVLDNVPWLIGSLGTMAEDVTIFVQFRIYGQQPPAAEEASAAVE